MSRKVSPTTYGLLGMLAVRPWTSYELTRQMRRSLRFVWPSSEGHLYREQKRLVRLGWADVSVEPAGGRTRKRYSITPRGRAALRAWLATDPEEPHFEIEGILRIFYGDQTEPAHLSAAAEATARHARAMLEEMATIAREYLDEGGPLDMLERGVGGDGARLEHGGRVQYPERLHVVAVALDVTTRLLVELDDFFTSAAHEVRTWDSTTDEALTPSTRRRLEEVASRTPGR